MTGKWPLVLLLSFSLVLAGCSVPNAGHVGSSFTVDRLWAVAEQDAAFTQVLDALSASKLEYDRGAATVSEHDGAPLLAFTVDHNQTVISVFFDASTRISAVIVVQLDDGTGHAVVSNVSTGEASRLRVDPASPHGEATVESGRLAGTGDLAALTTVEPFLELLCSACQREYEDLQAAKSALNVAYFFLASAQFSLLACGLPGPICLAAIAAVAATYANVQHHRSEVSRFNGYYNTCRAAYC